MHAVLVAGSVVGAAHDMWPAILAGCTLREVLLKPPRRASGMGVGDQFSAGGRAEGGGTQEKISRRVSGRVLMPACMAGSDALDRSAWSVTAQQTTVGTIERSGLSERKRRGPPPLAYLTKYFVPRFCPLVLSFFASISLITGSFSSLVATPMPLPICSIDWPSLAAT